MKQGSLFLFSFLFCSCCFAQRGIIDRLHRGLPLLKDTSLVNCLNSLSEAYLRTQTDSSRFFALAALSKAEEIAYVKGTALAYYNLGSNETMNGTLPKMEANLAKAVLALENDRTGQNEFLLAKSYCALGLSLWGQSKFDEALKSYEKSKQIATAIGNDALLGEIFAHLSAMETQRGQYKNSIEYCTKGLPLWQKPEGFTATGFAALAILYNTVGDYQTSLKYCREAYKISKPRGGAGSLHIWMGEIFYNTNQFDSAIYYYHKNLEGDSLQSDKTRRKAWSDSRMGEVFTKQKKYDTALLYLNNGLLVFRDMVDRNQTMWTLLRLGRVYEATKNYPQGSKILKELLRTATATGARQHIRDANLMLYRLFDAQHNNDSAYWHLRQYNKLKELIDSDQAEQRLAFFKTMREAENVRASLDKLKEEKRLQEFELKQASLQKYFLIIGMALLLGLGTMLFRNIFLKRRSEKDKRELAENELRMQKLENAKTKAELQHQVSEMEMQALRAQMNPHFIFNSLNSINRFILQNSTEQASEYLIKFSKLVRLILQNSQVPWVTLESELESVELYLELEVLRFEHRFDYQITLPKDIDGSALLVPPLIIQPFVENSIWHGLMHKKEHGHVDITIQEMNEYLFLTITDDGVGRIKSATLSSKSATRKKSLGSKITAERIAMLQRSPDKDSSVTINDLVHSDGTAAGTEVIIKLPARYD